MSVLYEAKDLRVSVKLRSKITEEFGVYKWWCKRDLLELFLERLAFKFNDIKDDLEEKNIDGITYYCVYVGDSKNLNNRFFDCAMGHILGLHNKRNIKDGWLSTLRATISSILFLDQSKQKDTNDVINQMYIEVFDYKDKINESNYHEKQNQYIKEKFRPLNNKDINRNNDIYLKYGYHNTKSGMKSKRITDLRKNGKKEGLKHV